MTTKTKPAKDWRFRAPGSASSLGFFLVLFFSLTVLAKNTAKENIDDNLGYNPFVKKASEFVDQSPYVPKKREYVVDMGTLWEEQTYGWLGGHVGFHLGRCFLLSQKDCQFYFDAMGGVGLHSDDSAGWLMAGWRMQFMNYPSPWSYSVRLITGLAHSSVQSVIRNDFLYGVGFAATRYLHPRMDARLEFRVGHTHQLFTQATFGLQIKVDEWITGFANSLQDLGKGVLKATGKVLKATGEAVVSPFKKGEDNASPEKSNKKK